MSARALLLYTYYLWTLANFLWGRDDEVYYNIYFISASVFEVIAFLVAARQAPANERVYYKLFLWAAVLKGLYVALLAVQIIPEANMPHHVWIWGILFVLITGIAIIINQWRRRLAKRS